MRYLDPKADLTFKRVFGEHPDLVRSFLNALLPLNEGEEITEIEYLPAEMVPDNPVRKNSIVDVRCRDLSGRQFIVEMQMVWSPEFKRRVMFNASKAYVRQIKTGDDYHLLQPVYSLNLVNDIFEPDMKEYYHYYRMVHVEHTDKVIDGLHLVFVELPKFNPHTFSEKKMHVLWLRYLTEINDQTREVPEELLANPEVKRAVESLEESAFNDAQLLGYEKFWDTISVEKTIMGHLTRTKEELARTEENLARSEKNLEKAKKDLERVEKKGREEGEQKKAYEIARQMKADDMPVEIIMKYSGLSEEEINQL